MLAACSDRLLETGLGWEYLSGEVKEIPPSPVRQISGTRTGYPNLSTVPDRPLGAVTSDTATLMLDRLAGSNRDAQLQQRLLEEQAPALPPPGQRPSGRPDPAVPDSAIPDSAAPVAAPAPAAAVAPAPR